MARVLASDDRYRDLAYDSDRRAHRTASGSLSDYRFGKMRSKSTHGPLNRINRALRRKVEAIVDSKLRRMERELELLGIQARDDR